MARRSFAFRSLLLLFALLVAGCDQTDPARNERATDSPRSDEVDELVFEFDETLQGWQAAVAGYSDATSPGMSIDAQIDALPTETNRIGRGVHLRATVRSPENRFAIIRKLGPEDGVFPDQSYRVQVRLRFASAVSQACFGPGGSPGATRIFSTVRNSEVTRVADGSGVWRFDVAPNEIPIEFVDLGEIGNGAECGSGFRMVDSASHPPILVQSGPLGELWVLIGVSPVSLVPLDFYIDEVRLELTND